MSDNKYTIIAELKELLFQCQKISSQEELSIFSSKVKAAIYNNAKLKEEFEKRCNQFIIFQKENLYLSKAIEKLLSKIIKTEKLKSELFESLSVEEIYFYPKLARFCISEVKYNYNSIYNLVCGILESYCFAHHNYSFRELNTENLKQNKKLSFSSQIRMNKKILQLGEYIDFYILQYENYVSPNALLYANDFFKLWLKTSLLGTLSSLIYFLNTRDSDNNINIKTDISICEKMTTRQKEVLHLFAKNNSISVIASMLDISEPTVRTHINDICENLNLEKAGTIALKDYLIKNRI